MNRLCWLLTMPWVASAEYSRLIAAVVVGGSLLVATVVALSGAGHAYPGWSSTFIFVLAFAIWFLWAGFLSASLQLARDARELRLPCIAGNADFSLLLYCVLSIALPALVCWALGMAPLLAVRVFLIAAASGMAYMLLPLYLGVPFTAGLVLAAMTPSAGTHPGDGWILLAALIAFVAWRWWRLRTAATVQTTGWNAPAVFACYQQYAAWHGGQWTFASSIMQKRPETPVHLDAHGLGPARPVASLRLAFGGLGAPKPSGPRLRDMGRVCGSVLIFVLFILALEWLGPHHNLESAKVIRTHWLHPLLIIACLTTCNIAVNSFGSRSWLMWRKPDAELALLALLPGLGQPSQVKRRAVFALLAPAVVFLAVIVGALFVGAFETQTTVWAYLSMALSCIGAFALIASVDLESLGGKPLHTARYALFTVGLLVLSGLVLLTSMPTDEYHGPHQATFGIPPVWAWVLWAIYLALLGLHAWQGWSGLRLRAHPFLASPP